MRKQNNKKLFTDEKIKLGKKLLSQAKKKVGNAYAPHSGVKVCCAILTTSGAVFFGVNVENDSYGLTICAERSALSAMVTTLGRKARISAVAVHSPKLRPCYPCGACRQALLPFVSKNTLFFTEGSEKELISVKFAELIPHAFRLR